MTITIETIEHPAQKGLTVEAVRVDSVESLRELRASDWVEGQLLLLTFPMRVVGYVGTEPPLAFSGAIVQVGDQLLKGPAGDLEVIPATTAEEA